ncbi:hypothetical protein M514_13320 [Trichuris suis]|uniref:Uncharacterized protein n=1 Tax=Trichuris suis TaxID=68888 RepID=A0A085LLG2_9BILA|nr:hypothetical protein M513_13320 [Trichuris suis]KFD59491.1 hypothetical protein M514_13320 [Trichuris suis]
MIYGATETARKRPQEAGQGDRSALRMPDKGSGGVPQESRRYTLPLSLPKPLILSTRL